MPIVYDSPLTKELRRRARSLGASVVHAFDRRAQRRKARAGRLSASGRVFTEEHFAAADDLEQLGTAKNFFEWVLAEFDPYLHGRVLEVGAGRGTITRKLLDRRPGLSVVALEPAMNMFADLDAYARPTSRVSAHRQTLDQYLCGAIQPFDAAIYLNVLEHIADDERELHLLASALRPEAALLVFAPALEWLYSELDYKAGHNRRYDVRRFERLARTAGLEVASLRYFDVLGVLPYLVVYKLLGHDGISGSTLGCYDRLIVPISRFVQRIVGNPPLGKNVVLVAIRPR